MQFWQPYQSFRNNWPKVFRTMYETDEKKIKFFPEKRICYQNVTMVTYTAASTTPPKWFWQTAEIFSAPYLQN